MTDIKLEVNNTTGHRGFRKVEVVTLPLATVAENNTDLYFIASPHGYMVGILTEVHGDHHRDMEIIGEWGPGRYDMDATPVYGQALRPEFRLAPSVLSELNGFTPIASMNGVPIVFDPIPQSRRHAASMWFVWKGKTETGPQVTATVHQRIGDLSSLCDVVGWAQYSDRTNENLEIGGAFQLSFSEPVSWQINPYRDGMQSERGHVMRGTIMFTPGELNDPQLNATPFYRGRVNIRAAAEHWENNFLIHSHLRGDDTWPLGRPLAQAAYPTSAGGRRSFQVQDLVGITDDPAVIEQLLTETDIEHTRAMHYLNTDGTPFNAELPENQQYVGAGYNSQIDFRLGNHDNFNKPLTWRPRGDATPQDWGHIALAHLVEAYALTSDPAKLQQLEDQAEMILIGTGFGDGPDRYAGQPVCAALLLHRILDASYKARLEVWIRGQLNRFVDFRANSNLDYNAPIWPGEAGPSYGVYVPNAPTPNGIPQGWAPWQLARYVECIMTVNAYRSDWIPASVWEDAIKMSESIVIEGFKRSLDGDNRPQFQSYYAVAYDNGQSVNGEEMAFERGLATGIRGPNDGYIWTCSAAIWIAANWSESPEIKARAVEMVEVMNRVCDEHEEAGWIPHIPTNI